MNFHRGPKSWSNSRLNHDETYYIHNYVSFISPETKTRLNLQKTEVQGKGVTQA